MSYQDILDERKRLINQTTKESHIEILLKFHPLILSGISLVSVICYFIYFGLFVGYFPALSGSDVFYFGGLIFL